MTPAPTRVQQPSLFSYHREIIPNRSERQAQVLAALAGRELTNSELAEALGWGINRVTPRMVELREAGRVVCRNARCPNPRHLNAMTDVVHDDCKRVCGVTRRNVFGWRIIS